MRTILTIAGSDPTGWAGVQADLGVFSAMNARGLSAVTALTLQSRSGVIGVKSVAPEFVASQVRVLAESYSIDAVKVGMLSTSATVMKLGSLLRKGLSEIVVIDPVLSSTGDISLLEEDGIAPLKALLPLVTVITPNLNEASILSGMEVKTLEDMKSAAMKLSDLGARNVVIKGGHLSVNPTDILYDGSEFYSFEGERLNAPEEFLHGTGCLFSSALAVLLAEGKRIPEAVGLAKKMAVKIIQERLCSAAI